MRKLIVSIALVVVLGTSLGACGKKGEPVYNQKTEQSKSTKTSG